MKKFCNYTFHMVCIYILVLSIFSIFNVEIETTNYNKNVHNVNSEKILTSSLLAQIRLSENEVVEKEESINEEESVEASEKVQEVVTEPESKQEEIVKPAPVLPSVNVIDTSNYAALSSETVNISHYGHDCYGCTGGQTASGYYIGDGRTYYNDPTFGSVRVVAADYKYPLGTIIRLNYNGSSFAAIVLDRGGAVGDHGKYQIDLLASSNSEAYQLGVINNASLEVLRYGY